MGVSVIPGQTQLTRMPYSARSSDSAFESINAPPFDATYAGVSAWATKELTDPRFTTVACFDFSSSGREYLVTRKIDRRFTLRTRSHSSAEQSLMPLTRTMPALFTR